MLLLVCLVPRRLGHNPCAQQRRLLLQSSLCSKELFSSTSTSISASISCIQPLLASRILFSGLSGVLLNSCSRCAAFNRGWDAALWSPVQGPRHQPLLPLPCSECNSAGPCCQQVALAALCCLSLRSQLAPSLFKSHGRGSSEGRLLWGSHSFLLPRLLRPARVSSHVVGEA